MEAREKKAGLIVLRFIRNVSGRRQALRLLRSSVDEQIARAEAGETAALKLFRIAREIVFFYQSKHDEDRLVKLCKLLLASMDRETCKGSYFAVALDQKCSVSWIANMKKLLGLCCGELRQMKISNQCGRDMIDLYLNMLILFTDYTLWKFNKKFGTDLVKTVHLLCSTMFNHLVKNCEYFKTMRSLLDNFMMSAYLTGQSLAAVLGLRQLALAQFPREYLSLFLSTVVSMPGLFLVIKQKSPETILKLKKVNFAVHLLKIIDGHPQLETLGVNSVLSIFGNMLSLCESQIEEIESSQSKMLMLTDFLKLISACEISRLSSTSSVTHYHPFYGWIKADTDRKYQKRFSLVQKQFQSLWYGPLVETLIGSPLDEVYKILDQRKGKVLIFRRQSSSIKQNNPHLQSLLLASHLYVLCVNKFTRLTTEILTGLSCKGLIISRLWHVLSGLSCLQEDFAFRILASEESSQTSLRNTLILTIQSTEYLIATLDDEEIHVQQLYFTVEDLRDISLFLKQLVCRMVMEERSPPVFPHCHSLLTLLYTRDCRRAFTAEPGFWIEKKLKTAQIAKQFKLGKSNILKLMKYAPFTVPFKKRIDIFLESVKEDKELLGIAERGHRGAATYITIRRGRVLEGGYEQLAGLNTRALKGTVRVKFVNEQGLDEAGIDETGVFKEFLEEFVSAAFNPDFGLFKVTDNGLLYPSPSSSIQDNHTSLFELVGCILGKAVYEGIIVDVQFASFFLSQILELHHSSMYSSLDELASLDTEVHKSLTYIKHAESGIEDLCLTFSWDDNHLGKSVSHELVPGGSVIEVTENNKISYVHRMAHFMLYTRLKKQSEAFLKGFHSIIPPSWISIFSPAELQSVISGEQVEFNVDDLRSHVEYFGGYHAKHRVVLWLWDVLKNDFNAEEKQAFLRFVTSCSRPPLLGFSQLRPPFSIRCVDINTDEERDTVGGIIKGFFSIRHSQSSEKLPSASTCFNLLKLPNYKKKSILRDKLKYAILAKAGFELS